jgi:hypothetical protein
MRVQFLRDTAKARLPELPKGTLVLYREGFGYGLPEIPDAEYMEWRDYKARYTALEPPFVVVVGLNRIITPSNRCDMVNEYLQTMTPNLPKICLDTAPFIGEPWRLWFHYSIADAGRFGVTYSYAIETEWKHWFERDVPDCRLSGSNIRLLLTDTYSDLDRLTTRFEFVEPSADEQDWYKAAKEQVFEKHSTPKMLVNSLLAMANKRFGLKIGYESYRENRRIEIPDVGVYRFVADEAMRRMKIYNEVVKYGTESLHTAERA